MKIGLFFGSFNPVHVGHLIIATHIVNFTDWKKVWFIVSPQNPLKQSNTLLNEHQRIHLVRLSIENDMNLSVNDIEFKMPKPSYTIDTLSYLKDKFPQHEFAIIMGSDSFQNLPKWKNFRELVNKTKILVYKRPGFETKKIYENQIVLDEVPLLEISATFIRQLINQGKSIRYLVSDKVLDEIEKGRYYK